MAWNGANRVEKETITLRKQPCVVCGGIDPGWNLYRSGLPSDVVEGTVYNIVRCSYCGSGMTEPLPSAEDMRDIYAGYGSRPVDPSTSPVDVLGRMRQAWGERAARTLFDPRNGIKRLQRRLLSCFLVPRATLYPIYTDIIAPRIKSRPPRLLDVGCGNCQFLHFARSAGVSAMGLEVSETDAATARRLGFDVRADSLADLAARGDQYDIIRFSHVLEHLPDPQTALTTAHRLLGQGGYLMVAVPQLPSAMTVLFGRHAWYHLPFHLYHFSRMGMKSLLARSGFEILTLKSKSNSMMIQSVARASGHPQWVNQPGWRLAGIFLEMVWDAMGWGDSMEIHAVAV